MSWLQKFLPSQIRTEGGSKKNVPEGLWAKCGSCNSVLYRAELERNLVSERTRAALSFLKQSGKHIGGVPFGFQAVDSKLVERVDESAVLEVILSLRAAGKTFREIARDLSALGYVTRNGSSQWSPSTVWGIVKRSRVNGEGYEAKVDR